jgi:predicted outer membrane repeat protein
MLPLRRPLPLTLLLTILLIFPTLILPLLAQPNANLSQQLTPLPLPLNPEVTAEVSPVASLDATLETPIATIPAPFPTYIAPTLSPDLEMEATAIVNSREIEPITIVGQKKYIFIPAGAVIPLKRAFLRASNDLNNTYILMLATGVYQYNYPDVDTQSAYALNSSGNVIIRGLDAATFSQPALVTLQRDQAAPVLYGLLNVAFGSFTMYDVRVRYGAVSDYGGGMFIGPGAVVNVFNSRFNSNSANNSTGQGGAIYNYLGTLKITNTSFLQNSAKVGGAIASYTATLTKTRQGASGTYCAFFDRNSATVNAGAVYSERSTTNVKRSIFSGNTAPSGAYKDIENSPVSPAGNVVNADNSWWSAAPSISPNVTTNSQIVGGTLPAMNCTVAIPPAPTLADYGIENTSPNDAQVLLAGVHKTGVALWRKFGQDATPLDSSIDAFKKVMYSSCSVAKIR